MKFLESYPINAIIKQSKILLFIVCTLEGMQMCNYGITRKKISVFLSRNFLSLGRLYK